MCRRWTSFFRSRCSPRPPAQARIAELGEEGFTYRVIGAREHVDVWTIAVQSTRADGKPLYDIMGFEVNKLTSEVGQMI